MHKSAIWDRTPPHLHIKCSLYVCSRVQGSQIFKQNSIISFRSKVIVILPICKQNRIISISSGLIEFWCFGLPVALGRGQVVGGVWGHGGVPMHMHTHTHMYTCIEIANGCQHGGIHVYHVQHACVCLHVHTCVHGTPTHTLIPTPNPHPPIHPPPWG